MKYNSGHCIEGCDRVHTLQVMVQKLLDQHPAIVKAKGEKHIERLYEVLGELYQAVGQLEEN